MQYESDHNDYKKAKEFCELAVSFYKKAGDHDKIAHSTRHLADLQIELNQLPEAEQNYKSAINMYRSKNDTQPGDLANALRGFTQLLEKKHEFTNAIETWKEILQLSQKSDFEEGVLEAGNKIRYLKAKLK